MSENVYPIAADANESENCLYFISGGEKLEDALLADICDISLTIGETDGKWALTESIHLWKHQKNSFKI